MTDSYLYHGYCKGERGEYFFSFSNRRELRLGFLSSLGLWPSIAACYSNPQIQFSFACVKHSFLSPARKSIPLPLNGANKIVYTHVTNFYQPYCLCRNAFVNDACFFILPTSWFKFYPLITSYHPCPPVLHPGLHYAHHFMISLAWFSLCKLLLGLLPSALTPVDILRSPLYPSCTYLLLYTSIHILQYCPWFACVSSIRLHAPCRQEFCLIHLLPQHLAPNIKHSRVPISVYGTGSSEDKDFLQRVFKEESSLTPKK